MRTLLRSLFLSIVCLVAGSPVLPGQVRPGGTGRLYALPLQVSPDHRYLADAQGKPFLYHADTGWMLFVHPTPAEARQYLLKRRDQGFTVIQVMLTGFADTTNWAGQRPFGGDDLTQPNEAFFRHADWVIRQADSLGLVLAVAPLWVGCCGEGWGGKGAAIERNGPEKCFRYGQYLANRYQGFRNVLWIIGGDNDPHAVREPLRQLALGIKQRAPKQLVTYHAASSHSSTDVWEDESWLDFSMVYTYFRGFPKAWNKVQPNVYEVSHTEYRKAPTRPFILGESTYEGEHGAMGSALQARKQAYWALLSGAAGHAYGSPVWAFRKDWQQHLELPGAKSLGHLAALFAAIPWHTLVPDGMGELLPEGGGAYAANDYAASAVARDGRLALAYLPYGRPVAVNLGRLRGKMVRATWFNPRSGARTTAGAFTGQARATLTPPDPEDWVLLLEVNG
jgi:hypothetical protein